MTGRDHAIAGLRQTALMLETWGPEAQPTLPTGQVTFSRALMDSAAGGIRAFLAVRKRERRASK